MAGRSGPSPRRRPQPGPAAGFLVLAGLILSLPGLRADVPKPDTQPAPPGAQPAPPAPAPVPPLPPRVPAADPVPAAIPVPAVPMATSDGPVIPPVPPLVPPTPVPVPGGLTGGAPGAQMPGGPGFGTGGPLPPNGQFVGMPGPGPGFPGPRFTFTIDPKTAVKDLLPTPPKAIPSAGPVLVDDLRKVPELEFAARPAKDAQHPDLVKQTAHQLAKINHANAKKRDAFMVALLENRPDLAGLPFQMGDDCRTPADRSRQFIQAVALVRQALGVIQGATGPGTGAAFWNQYNSLCTQVEASQPKTDKATAEHITLARIAALMQMLAPESAEVRAGLVRYLCGVPHVESTRALARLAIFSPEDEVRLPAVDALKVRREKDYTEILVKGLRYPWPAVAKRAADTIARLDRSDLIPELVGVLDEADPRLPVTKESGGQKSLVVREMVRVNHHRNCMMCHAPGNPGVEPVVALTAEVPVPGSPLPTPAQGYNQSTPDLLVRIDVTYLRQDFSALLTVPDAHPWPELQRFDFLVRERAVTAEEADAYKAKLTPKEPGVLSPYHKAALAALREMTGKDTAPNADAWRKLLDLPKASKG